MAKSREVAALEQGGGDRGAACLPTAALTDSATHSTAESPAVESDAGTGIDEDHGDLSPFVAVEREDDRTRIDFLSRYDGDVDIPLPRTHSDVVHARAAKRAAGRRLAAVEASEEGSRPFSRLNRARTSALLVARELRSRQEVEKAQNASLNDRGIDQDLTQSMKGLNVLEQARHPRLGNVPLLSRMASSAGSTQGRGRKEMALITKAFGFCDDNDHRVAAVSMQGKELDNAWAALLGSTLRSNRTVRSINLNRNSIEDKGVALLIRSLRANPSLEHLSLGGNRLTDEAAKTIASLLRSGCSSLRQLNLSGVPPKPVSMMQSGSGARDHLTDKCIRAPGAAALALAISDPASSRGSFLLTLNLAFQKIWDAGATALAAALRTPWCHLEALGLSATNLTDAAAFALSRSLSRTRARGCDERQQAQLSLRTKAKENIPPEESNNGKHRRHMFSQQKKGGGVRDDAGDRCPLRRLDLSRNAITDEGAIALVLAISHDSGREAQDLFHEPQGSPEKSCEIVKPLGTTPARYPSAPPTPFAAEFAAEASRARASCLYYDSTATRTSSSVLLGLDLAYNCVSSAGIGALADALYFSPSLIFLELRGNADDAHLRGMSRGEGEMGEGVETCDDSRIMFEKIEQKCAERRVVLQREPASFGRTKSTNKRTDASFPRSPELETGGVPYCMIGSRGGGGRMGDVKGGILKANRTQQVSKTVKEVPRNKVVEMSRLPGRRTAAATEGTTKSTDSSVRGVPVRIARQAGDQRETHGSSVKHTNDEGVRSEGGFISPRTTVKPRPLEGRLPLRGYYLSPLLDSCFDLLMLREPLRDPADARLYSNRVRKMLAERKRFREQEGVRDKDGSGVPAKTKLQDAAGGFVTPFSKGALVSPLAIHREEENILAERRRLFATDRDFSTRKSATVSGRGKAKTARSKVLTQKRGNVAFTRELMSHRTSGVCAKCPSGLRSHFLGLQNFQYDWGGDGY